MKRGPLFHAEPGMLVDRRLYRRALSWYNIQRAELRCFYTNRVVGQTRIQTMRRQGSLLAKSCLLIFGKTIIDVMLLDADENRGDWLMTSFVAMWLSLLQVSGSRIDVPLSSIVSFRCLMNCLIDKVLHWEWKAGRIIPEDEREDRIRQASTASTRWMTEEL